MELKFSSYKVESKFIEGNTYSIVWEGSTYKCVARNDGAGNIYIGNQQIAVDVSDWGFEEYIVSDEPFFMCNYKGTLLVGCSTPGTYTASIFLEQEDIVKIPEKYIPESVQSDWSQTDPTAINYIKNKTHGEFVDIITLHSGTHTTESGEGGYYTYLDEFECNFELGKTYYVTFDDVEYECVAWAVGDGDVFLGNGDLVWRGGKGENVPFAFEPNTYGVCFLTKEAGTYTISISTQNIITKTIPDKYLPSDLSRVGHTHTPEERKGTYILLDDVITGFTYTVYMHNGNLTSALQCVGIKVITPPDNIDIYPYGDFDPTGMAVVAQYSDGSREILDNSLFADIEADRNGYVVLSYTDAVGVTHTVRHKGTSWSLVDFEYDDNGNGTYTLTAWNETLNGEPSTELVIPDDPNIIL